MAKVSARFWVAVNDGSWLMVLVCGGGTGKCGGGLQSVVVGGL